MKKYLWIFLLTVALAIVTMGAEQKAVYAATEETNDESQLSGWVTDSEGNICYYVNGEAVTGLYTIDGKKYYFNEDGTMYTGGWLTFDDGVSATATYYFSEDGSAYTGNWYTIAGKKYFFNNSGRLHYGWRTDSATGYKYYCDPTTGVMQTGWKTIKGYKYYFNTASGIMQTGWKTINGKKYYFNVSGRLHYGWTTISGARYYCDPATGIMQTGWKTINGKKYYFNVSGRLHYGWTTISGARYYCDPTTGVMKTGLQTINGYRYYFNSSGVMQKCGWKTINGYTYYFNKSTGKAYTGWHSMASGKYYFGTSGTSLGRMAKGGWKKISGYYYYFNSNGVLQTNQIVGSSSAGYYYVDEDGIRVTSSEITYAVKFVIDHTKTSWSNSKKLETCYNYLWKNYTYKRTYETPDASTMSDEAISMFKNKYGNCYKYAACFACIAKVLGYESRVCVGEISAARGGMTPHGWTEVKVGSTWYLCDPDMQMNHPSKNVYMVTESNYPYKHTVTTKYTLTISKGKVTWK